jgi:(2Fe-2S) ferredoxin
MPHCHSGRRRGRRYRQFLLLDQPWLPDGSDGPRRGRHRNQRGGWLHALFHRSRRSRHEIPPDADTAPDALSLPPPEETSVSSPVAVRLFACVGKHCRSGQNGRALIDALRAAADQAGPDAGPIAVTPCGCLDRCEEGPVVVAYRGKAAQASRPPQGALAEFLNRPFATFTRVTPETAGRIIATVGKTQ